MNAVYWGVKNKEEKLSEQMGKLYLFIFKYTI